MAEIFFEKAANTLLKYADQNLALKTLGILVFGPLYNLSQIKLRLLWEYISNDLIKRFIQPSTLSTGPSILFIKKKDNSLQLYVNDQELDLITEKNCYPLPEIL